MSKELINSGKNWWWTQRCRYNKGLFCAGLIAFFIYCTLGELIIARYTEFEETIFEMAFQGGCYMFLMMSISYLIRMIARNSEIGLSA
jgi:hypothetical protein